MTQQSRHGSEPSLRTPAKLAVAAMATAGTTTDHRPQPEPTEFRCTCGRLREACLHDVIIALWPS